jgi:hypothetical protein
MCNRTTLLLVICFIILIHAQMNPPETGGNYDGPELGMLNRRQPLLHQTARKRLEAPLPPDPIQDEHQEQEGDGSEQRTEDPQGNSGSDIKSESRPNPDPDANADSNGSGSEPEREPNVDQTGDQVRESQPQGNEQQNNREEPRNESEMGGASGDDRPPESSGSQPEGTQSSEQAPEQTNETRPTPVNNQTGSEEPRNEFPQSSSPRQHVGRPVVYTPVSVPYHRPYTYRCVPCRADCPYSQGYYCNCVGQCVAQVEYQPENYPVAPPPLARNAYLGPSTRQIASASSKKQSGKQ